MVLMAVKFSSPGRLISSQDLFCGDGGMEGEERRNREGGGLLFNLKCPLQLDNVFCDG